MRVSGLLHVIAVVACLCPLASAAQTAAQRRAAASAAAEEQIEPFHKHRDTRHGHDHYYPDRGAIVRDLPVGTIGTSYAGVSYRYHDGIWLEPRGPAYMVVLPPIGLIAPTLPLYSTVVTHAAESFLYCNDTYYRPRPDLGGYEVVNDPAMESGVAQAPEALVGGQMPSAVAAGAVGGAGMVAGNGAAMGSAVGAVPGAGFVGVAPGAAAAVPVVAREGSLPREASAPREAGPLREASLSGGTMPGVATLSSATPSSATMSSATLSSGAAAASVPAPSLGAGAGASAPAAPAGVGGAAVAGSTSAAAASAAGTQRVPKVFLYPRNGQSADQQARDRYDCYRFAVGQSGFDPMRTTGIPAAPSSEQQSDFERAQSACFEGRGYSNR